MNDAQMLLESAPILSKYHGHHGFEVGRFITDYEAWRVAVRAAISAPASSGASEPAESVRQPLTDDEVTRLLPPLPAPSQRLGSHCWAYSSEDMRAYGQSCADKVKRAIAHLRFSRHMQ